jgi:hypothetical protein
VYGTVHIGPLPLGNLLTGSSNLVLQKEYIWALLRIEPENQTACLASSPISASAYRYVYLKKSSTTSVYPDAVHLTSVHFHILELMPVLKYCMGTGIGLKNVSIFFY